MPKFHVIAGPDATPAYPIVRKIGPADLRTRQTFGMAAAPFLTTAAAACRRVLLIT